MQVETSASLAGRNDIDALTAEFTNRRSSSVGQAQRRRTRRQADRYDRGVRQIETRADRGAGLPSG